jgi:alkyl sulfatase BDS1-like metallo-beta-lactamase superfamily hydrolase
MHVRLQAQNKSMRAVTATRFFDEICPAVLDARRAAVVALGGAFAFLVRGEGRWVLDFDSASVVTLDAHTRAEVDIAFELDAADFTRLMKGTLDVAAAVTSGALHVRGNLDTLSKLTAVLRPSN